MLYVTYEDIVLPGLEIDIAAGEIFDGGLLPPALLEGLEREGSVEVVVDLPLDEED